MLARHLSSAWDAETHPGRPVTDDRDAGDQPDRALEPRVNSSYSEQQLTLYKFAVDSDTNTCSAEIIATVAQYDLSAGDTVFDDLAAPIVVRATSGGPTAWASSRTIGPEERRPDRRRQRHGSESFSDRDGSSRIGCRRVMILEC